jgi:hypothetical protein
MCGSGEAADNRDTVNMAWDRASVARAIDESVTIKILINRRESYLACKNDPFAAFSLSRLRDLEANPVGSVRIVF